MKFINKFPSFPYVHYLEASSELRAKSRQHISLTITLWNREICLHCNLNISNSPIICSLCHILWQSFLGLIEDAAFIQSSCLLQERHWRSLARDHAVLSEWAHLRQIFGHTWKGVREWLCLLLLCLLYFPLLLPGQCSDSYQPKQAHHYCSMSSHPTATKLDCLSKKKKKKSLWTWLKYSIVFRIGLGI